MFASRIQLLLKSMERFHAGVKEIILVLKQSPCNCNTEMPSLIVQMLTLLNANTIKTMKKINGQKRQVILLLLTLLLSSLERISILLDTL
jgi:hypothetical protein